MARNRGGPRRATEGLARQNSSVLSIGHPAEKPKWIPSNRQRPDGPIIGKTRRCDRRCQDVRGFTRDTIEPRDWARQQLTLPAVGRAPLTPASLFPLLEEALRPEVAHTYLQREWHAVLLDLRHLHTSQTPTV